jgi:hypothetical protein
LHAALRHRRLHFYQNCSLLSQEVSKLETEITGFDEILTRALLESTLNSGFIQAKVHGQAEALAEAKNNGQATANAQAAALDETLSRAQALFIAQARLQTRADEIPTLPPGSYELPSRSQSVSGRGGVLKFGAGLYSFKPTPKPGNPTNK